MRAAEPTRPEAAPCAGLCWRDDLSSAQWDEALAALEGHPLQSAAWGDARRAVDGIEDLRLAAFIGDDPVFLARVELRPVLGWWRVGWVPRGPTAAPHPRLLDIAAKLRDRCRDVGCSLLVVDPYRPSAAFIGELGRSVGPPPRTIYLDLTLGREALLAKLDRSWRYNLGLARRKGVSTELVQDEDDIKAFWGLCRRVSAAKGFELPGSLELLRHLVQGHRDGPVRYRLFVARLATKVAGGGAVAVSGGTLHQQWSAIDRDLRRHRPSEALRWAEIEWALSEGLKLYDLEGIDPQRNPGTYSFKSRMGGNEVTLPGRFAIPLSAIGRAGAWLLERALRA